MQRTAEDDIPLPNPFPLPKHYGSDVEAALQAKKFCRKTQNGFISKVASAMLFYKSMPIREDYINVSQAVIAKYSFLKSTGGTSEVLYKITGLKVNASIFLGSNKRIFTKCFQRVSQRQGEKKQPVSKSTVVAKPRLPGANGMIPVPPVPDG